MMKKRDEHKVAVDARKHFFRERKSYNIKCNTMYLTEKGDFLRKMITKHELNVVKSGVNIIPARNVKMRGIVKVHVERI